MNSVLQCLAQASALTDFFLDDQKIKRDINTTSKLGSKGYMALSYAILLRNLWHFAAGNVHSSSFSPTSFKAAIAKRNERFRGYGQQDAQVCALGSMLCVILFNLCYYLASLVFIQNAVS